MTDPPDVRPAADPDSFVARAIESVLEAVPSAPTETGTTDLTKYQPWADTAAPSGRNKRPLESLLDELRERVEAEPHALAAQPQGRRPAVAYFDRFGTARREGAPGSGKRRRRGRGSGQGAPEAARPAAAAKAPAATRPPAPPPGGGQQERGAAGGSRRRRRRGGRGGQPRASGGA